MIVVGGFNSAIDKFAETESLEPGAVMRLANVRALPGGKGLHVALACATLGEPVTLVGTVDAASRPMFDALLGPAGVRFDPVVVDEPIRTCLAVRDGDGRTTELLEAGPTLPPSVGERLSTQLLHHAAGAQHVVLSGSLPAGLPPGTYATLIERARHARVLLDASGAALANGIAARPFAVKPNRQEAQAHTNIHIRSREDALVAAAALGSAGPSVVLLSLGGEGAVLWDGTTGLFISAPRVEVRNTVGAGDCLLGGFTVALSRGWSLEAAGRYAVACGTAKVQHAETGLLLREDVDRILPHVTAEALTDARPHPRS